MSIEDRRTYRRLLALSEASDRRIAEIAAEFEEAQGDEGTCRKRVETIQSQISAILFADYPLRSNAQGYPESGPSDEILNELARLERVLQGETEALGRAQAMTTSIAKDLQNARIKRDVLGGQLAQVRGRLSDGERVQAGEPAPAFAEHTRGVAAARERDGVGG